MEKRNLVRMVQLLNESGRAGSRRHRRDDPTVHGGEPTVKSLPPKREPAVIDARQVQDRDAGVASGSALGRPLPRCLRSSSHSLMTSRTYVCSSAVNSRPSRNRVPFFQTAAAAGGRGVLGHEDGMVAHWRLPAVVVRAGRGEPLPDEPVAVLDDRLQPLALKIRTFPLAEPEPAAKRGFRQPFKQMISIVLYGHDGTINPARLHTLNQTAADAVSPPLSPSGSGSFPGLFTEFANGLPASPVETEPSFEADGVTSVPFTLGRLSMPGELIDDAPS